MPSQTKSADRPDPQRPDQALRRFVTDGRKSGTWPAWMLVRWEDSFLFKRWLQQVWDILSTDKQAERVILYPRDHASVETLFQDISSPSLFSSTRFIIAHVTRPIQRTIPLHQLAELLKSVADRTVLVLAVEGMSPLNDELGILTKGSQGGPRGGFEVAVWRPYNEKQLMDVARELLSVAGVQADMDTLKFWLDRIGSNLERLQTEARRLKIQFPDGEVTQDRLEEIFEVPRVHDETLWQAMRAILHGDPAKSLVTLQALLQSSDAFDAASEVSRNLLCVHALSKAGREGMTSRDVFLRYGVTGKRRQQKMLDLVSGSAGLAHPTPDLAGRLLSLDLALKQSKTAAGRQEVVLRSFLALCGEPQPAA